MSKNINKKENKKVSNKGEKKEMKKVKVNRVNKNTNLIENFYNEHSGKGTAIDMDTVNVYTEEEIKEKFEIYTSKLNKSKEVFKAYVDKLDEAIENNTLNKFFKNQMKEIKKLFSSPLNMENESDKIEILKIIILIFSKKIFDDMDDELFKLLKEIIIINVASKEIEDNEKLSDKEKLVFDLFTNSKDKNEFINKFIDSVLVHEKEKLLVKIENEKFEKIFKFINSELFPVSADGKIRELLIEYPNYESTINWLIEKMDNIKIMIKSDIEFMLDKTLPKEVIEKVPFDYIGDGVMEHYESNYLLIKIKEKCVNIEDKKVKDFFNQFYCTKEEEKDENK